METIATINKRLEDHFGHEHVKPRFRVVWANDELEKRLIDCTPEGIQLLHPEVREVKKYPYLKDLYILEKLVEVPVFQQNELPTSRLSYECIWAFRDNKGMPLPPIWDACKFVIDTMHAAMGDHSAIKRYVDTEENTTPEGKQQRITKIQEELFGDETETGDALRYQEGIVVPPTYESDEVN
jgi:hypothetical protein